MALRTVQPRKAKTPKPAPGGLRTASPSTSPTKPAMLGALTNLATVSGGTPPAGGGSAPGDNAATPWESDPVLQQIKTLQESNIAVAKAQALAASQKALIDFGYSQELDQQGLYGDQNTAGAAKANSFSVLGQLGQQHEQRQKNLNEGLNKANLFYSSTRGVQLGQEGQQYLGEQYQASQKLQGLLGQISQSRLGAEQGAQGAIAQGTEDAYTRWLNQQLQYGLGNAGSGQTMRAIHATSARGNLRSSLLRGRRP